MSGEDLESSNGADEFGSNSGRSFVTAAPIGQSRDHRAPSQLVASTLLDAVGTFLVLAGIAVGILTPRFALVLIHGVMH